LSANDMRVALFKEGYHGFNLFDKNSRTLKNEGLYKSGKVTEKHLISCG